MKNKKVLIGSIIGVIVAIVTILAVVVANIIQDKIFEASDYLTKGEYYKLYVEENHMSSSNYTGKEIENATDYNVFAHIMVEWDYITEKQAKNLNKPLTKEIVAQTIVKSMIGEDTTYNIDIKDINKCYDKQAIMDAVGMEIFELEDVKFNPNDYMTLDDVKLAFEKEIEIISAPPERKEAEVDWDDLKINIDGDDYIYPYNISQFLSNGWQVSSDDQNIIKQTVAKARELSDEEKQFYIQNNFDISNVFNSIIVVLNKGNSTIEFCADNTQSDVLVKDANIINMVTKNVDFKFYGVENGFTIEEVEDLFGTRSTSTYNI